MAAVKHVGPLVLYGAYVLAAGSWKDGTPPAGMSDKTAHFIVFGLMVPVALLAVGYFAPRASYAIRLAVAVGLASAFGALLEIWQLLLPWRTAELLDWVADTFGALAVGAILLAYREAMSGAREGQG